jgi:hypothetical protein
MTVADGLVGDRLSHFSCAEYANGAVANAAVVNGAVCAHGARP